MENGKKNKMKGTLRKDNATKVVTVDKSTSVIKLLKNCSDFMFETTQLKYTLDILNTTLVLTPKCHPEISGKGVE